MRKQAKHVLYKGCAVVLSAAMVIATPAIQPKDYTYNGVVGMEVGIPGEGGSGNWWKLYQPVTESVCDNGETWLGTKEELQSLCKAAESYGIKVIVDIVANHMGNITGWKNSLSDVSPQVGKFWNEDMLSDETFWHINNLQVWMSDGREHFTQGSMGMLDLNTADPRVQKYISDYLVELIDCGVDGFRFDAAKHIETPDDDPAFASDFWPNVLGYVWASKEAAAVNHFNNRFVNCPDNMGNDGNIAYCVRGQGIVLMSMDGPGNVNMSSHGLADGVYTDEVSGNTFTVSGGRISGNIASEYGIAVIYQNVMPNPGQDYSVQVGASVADGTVYYTDVLEVTVSERYAETAEYVASTGEKGTFKDSETITIGKGLSAGETVTLVVKGTNGSGTKQQVYTYIKDEYNLSNCIYFKNDKGWSSVTAYMWNDKGSTITNNASWPGEVMFECDSVNNIYAVRVNPDKEYNKIIFSNGGASQTADLDIGGIGYCYDSLTGTWYKYNENNDDVTPSVKTTVESSIISGETSVTYTVSNASSAKYSINGGEEVEFTGSVTLNVGVGLAEGQKDTVVISAVNGSKTKTETYTYEMDYRQPSIVATEETQTTTEESLTVTFTVSDTQETTITVNGVTESFTGSITKKFTETTEVVINAINGTKNVSASYKYTFVSNEDMTNEDMTEVFFDVSQCGWFGNDKAVAAVKFDTDNSFVACETVSVNGKLYYKALVPEGAVSVVLCRMLPSGNTYNEVTISLVNGTNLWTSDSGLGSGKWTNAASLGNSNGPEDPKKDTITVYFTNNSNWDGTIKAYYWGSAKESVSWPGVEMTYVGKDSSGYDVYKMEIPADIIGLIFTNGSAQTVDITTNLEDGAEFKVSGNSGGKYGVTTLQ